MAARNWDRERSRRLVKDRKRQAEGSDAAAIPVLHREGCCWCGEPTFHDWPGKQDGAPHPR